jgi:uncharacterized NAD-dependent epimerase/dehydratase family protein
VHLQEIDSEMCTVFGVAPDPGKYYHQWVDTIGLALARGQSFDDVIKDCIEGIEAQSKIANEDGVNYWTIKLKIAEYLKKNFISAALDEDR